LELREASLSGLTTYTKHLRVLNSPDGRTKEARILKSMRQELTKLLDHPANAAELALIDRCAWLQLRLAAMDRKTLDGTFTSFDGDIYNAHTNSLARGLQRLGLLPNSVLPQHPLSTAASSPALDDIKRCITGGKAA
jgi:hypothetical protein